MVKQYDQDKIMLRKHFYTQLLFSLQPKRVSKGSDNRHLSDAENPLFEYHVKGEDAPRYEPKGLRHDTEVWFEEGHHHDASFSLSSIIFFFDS
jgi:hypothetical protein